jgi:hypothetical protein
MIVKGSPLTAKQTKLKALINAGTIIHLYQTLFTDEESFSFDEPEREDYAAKTLDHSWAMSKDVANHKGAKFVFRKAGGQIAGWFLTDLQGNYLAHKQFDEVFTIRVKNDAVTVRPFLRAK